MNTTSNNNQYSFPSSKLEKYAQKGWDNYKASEQIEIKKSLHQKVQAKYGETSKKQYKIYPKLLLAAAAIGLLMMAVFLLDNDTSTSFTALNLELAPDQILSTVPLASERGMPNEAKAVALQNGVDYYQKGDFKLAANAFENYLKHKDTRPEVHLYYGQCLLHSDPEKAIDQLEIISTNSTLDQVYLDRANWFKALALVNLNREKEANQLLKTIAQSTSEQAQDADRLLLFLEKNKEK